MKQVIAILCAAVLGCAGGNGTDPAPHIVPVPSEQCPAACDVMLNKLVPADAGPDVVGCEEGKPIALKDGGQMSCVEFCKYELDNGVNFNTDCIVNKIQTCEQIESVCNK